MTTAGIATLVSALLAAGIFIIHVAVAVGAVITLFLQRSLERRAARSVAAAGAARVTVSVVVPAKNEQFSLPRLLSSLEEQDTDDFEIVLVNDRSTDDTARVMEEFRTRLGDRVVVVTVTEAQPEGNPKQHALAHGARAASGDVLLLTDADCVVPPSWVRRSTGYFGDPRLGLVFGPVYPKGTDGWLTHYQSFDHVFRYYYTAGSAGLSNATGGFGNNLAVRVEALTAVGGFQGLRHSATEDAELISEVRDTKQWLIRAHINRGATVHPEPQRTLGALFKQELRWHIGALFSPDWATRVSFGVVMLFLFVSVLAAPLAFWFPPILLLAAGSFSSMVLMAVVAGAFSKREPVYWLLLIPNVVFSMLFYSLTTLRTLLPVKISWKGTTLRR